MSLLGLARTGPGGGERRGDPLAQRNFPEAQSPTVSHSRSPTGKRDVPAPVAFSSFLLTASDVVGGGGQQL